MRNLVALLILAPSLLTAQGRAGVSAAPATLGRDFVRENYTKFEYRIPMRDGVKLFTSVYIPKDVFTDDRTYPDPDAAHRLQRRALRHRPVSRQPRPLRTLRAREIHLRLPGRARPLS